MAVREVALETQLPGANLARPVGFAETVPAVRDGERPVTFDGCLEPVTLAIGGFLDVCDLILRRVVILVGVEQREMALPDALDAWRLREPFVMHGRRLLLAG